MTGNPGITASREGRQKSSKPALIHGAGPEGYEGFSGGYGLCTATAVDVLLTVIVQQTDLGAAHVE